MEGLDYKVTGNIYLILLKIYNSKKNKIYRLDFCNLINISETNYTTYKKLRLLMEYHNLASFDNSLRIGNEKIIKINRIELRNFIDSLDFLILTEDYLHNSRIGVVT